MNGFKFTAKFRVLRAALLLLVIANVNPVYGAESFSCSNVDLWFGNDESASVLFSEFVDSRNFIDSIGKELTFGASSANGSLFSWSGPNDQKFIFALDSTFSSRIPQYNRTFGGQTAISKAIEYGHDLIANNIQPVSTQDSLIDSNKANTGGRSGKKQILVILTDATSSQIGTSGDVVGSGILAAASAFKSDATITEPTLAIIAIDFAAIQSDVLTSAVSSSSLYQEAPSYPGISNKEIINVARTLCPTYNTNVVYTKTLKSGDSTPAVGDTIVFKIVAQNTGTKDAPLLIVQDNFPAGLTFVSAALTSSNSYTSGTGVWDIGDLVVGETATLEITATVNAGQAGNTIKNVIVPFDDNDTTGDDLEESITVLKLPTITKSFNPTSVLVGASSKVTLTIGNSNAEDITLTSNFTDTLPAGVTVATTPNLGGTCIGTVTASAGTNTIVYANGSTISANSTCTITVDVTSISPGTATNTIAIGDLATTASANGLASSVDLTVTVAPPTIAKSFSVSGILSGGTATLTISLQNSNPISGTLSSILTDTLPTGMTIAATPNIGGTCAGTVTAVAGSGTVTYASGAALPAGGCTVKVDVTSATAGDSTNTIAAGALVTSLGNNASPATAVLNVGANADLITVKTLSSGNAKPVVGDTVSFLITVTNGGPLQSTNITLTDSMPAGITLTGNTPSAGTTYNTGTGVWDIGTLNLSASATLTLTGTVDADQKGQTITNTTTAASTPDQTDITTAGDDLTEAVTVLGDADLITVKTLSSSDSTPAINETVSFLITVNNNGPIQTTNVSLTDQLPAGLTLTGNTPSAGTSYNTGTGVWTIGTMANGASATLTLMATVNSNQVGLTITNNTTAASTADQNDPTTAGDDLTEAITIQQNADLVTVKTLSSGDNTPAVGDTVSFLITVSNNGPSQATNVSLTDQLPSGMTLTANTPSAGTTYNTGTGVWTIGTLANGSNATLTLTGTINTGQDSQAVTNTTLIATTPDQYDPTTVGDDLTETVNVLSNANLVTVKTLSSADATPVVGDVVSFLITVSNSGPAQATNVTLTDQIPSGITLTGNTPSAGTSYVAGTGVWTIGTINNGSNATLVLTGTVDIGEEGNAVTNTTTAATTNDQNDPTTTGDDLTETINIAGNDADLVTVKTLSSVSATLTVGETVSFLITVTNNGPDQATGVTLTDQLPAGLSLVTNAPAGGTSYNTGSGLWTIGTLNNGASTTLTLSGTVNTGQGGNSITNITSAASTPNQNDPTTSGDDLTETISVANNTDLQTVKTLSSGNDTPTVGDVVTFLITVTNNGPIQATNVSLNDLLPSGLTLTANSASAGTTYNTGSGLWTIGSLGNGSSATLSLSATVNNDQGGKTITNTTTAASTPDQSDPSTNGDDLTESITVANDVDLQTVKTLSSGNSTPGVGDSITFLITVTNNGPIDATNISLSDALPSGLTLTANVPDAGSTYIPSSGLWSIPSLANGSAVTLSLSATVDTGQGGKTITNVTTAATSSDQNDPTTSGDDLTESIEVTSGADLVTVKTVSGSATNFAVGETVSFVIIVTNKGPIQATNVSLSDSIPAGLTSISAVVSQGNYDGSSWSVGTLGDGASATLTLTATVDTGQASKTIINTTTAASTDDQNDPTTDGDSLSASITVGNSADLVTVKTVSTGISDVLVGDSTGFLITVTNKGPTAATNVSLVDSLPAGITVSSTTASVGTSYEAATGLWNIGALAKDASASLTLLGTIDADQADQTITNTTTAAMTSDQQDTSTSGDVLNASVRVQGTVADLVTVKTLSSGNVSPAISDTVVFLISVKNNGAADATNVSLIDLMPGGLTLVGNTPSQGAYNAISGEWTLGTLSNGATAILSLNASVDTDQKGKIIVNTSTAASSPDQTDPTTNGDDLSESITVTNPLPEIGAALSASADGEIGSDGSFDVTYVIVVQNTGDQGLSKLQLFDDLTLQDQLGGAFGGVVNPPVVTLSNNSGNSVAPTSNGENYDGTNGLVVGTDGFLAVGDSYQIIYSVKILPNGFNAPVTFNALATARGVDPAGTTVSDNTNAGLDPSDKPGGDGDPTLVKSADISLNKLVLLTSDADNSTTLTPGDKVQFTLVVNNAGPDDGKGIEVTDLLTERYAYVDDSGNGSYDVSTGLWVVGDIAVGESQTLVINALVRSSGPISNTAQVTRAFVTDPDSSPNNDDGDQSEDDESASPPNPNLGLASQFGTPIPLQGGDFTIPVSIIVENNSIVDLKLIDLQEDLGSVFGANNVVIFSVPIATGGLVINVDFDAVNDTNLLDLSQSRLQNSSDAIISFVIRVTPTPGKEVYTHNAIVSAFSDDKVNPSVVVFIDDVSTAGTEPDTNGNNNAEEDEPNIITLKIAADAGVALAASPAVPVDDNTTEYEITLTATIANLGNSPLTNVSLENDLAQLFPLGFEIISAPTVSLGTLVINPNFNGDSDTNLLDSDPADGVSSAIGVGEVASLSLRVRFTPGRILEFQHQFNIGAEDAAGNSLGILSADGRDPKQDPSPTLFNLVAKSSIGFAQSASPPIPVTGSEIQILDLVYRSQLSLVIENLGNTPLTGIQINESIISAFPQGGEINILNAEVLEGSVSLNGSFDGVGNSALLSGNDTLGIGERVVITIDFQFDLPDNTIVEEFLLGTNATGVGILSGEVSDISNNGSETDPNKNGNADETGENIKTPIKISSTPIIGLVQQIAADENGIEIRLIDEGDQSLPLNERELTYQFTVFLDVVNVGNTTLDDIELVNYLTSTFPSLVNDGKVEVSAPRVISGSLVPNLDFDGINDASLLDSANSSLGIQESAQIEFDVKISIDFTDTQGLLELQRQSFNNTAAVNGTAPNGARISDISNDAADLNVSGDAAILAKVLDEDGDFDPNEAGENDPTPVVFPSAVQGELFEDTNGNGIRDPDEKPLTGWSVVIRDKDGQIIGTELVDATGYYAIPSIPPGLYTAEFVTPNGVVARTKRGLANSTAILNLNFAIDPRGVVYNSVTRLPVNGVQLFFRNVVTGERLEDSCLGQNQQGQITGVTLGLSDGEYKFDVNLGLSANCPNEATVYAVEVVVDDEEFVSPSLLIPVESGVVSAATCPIDAVTETSRCEVVANQFAPQIGEATTYFFRFELGSGDPDIINNHIPIDPLVTSANVLLTKVANKPRVSIGDLVPYTITAENLNNNAIVGATLSDVTPAGFKYLDGSAQLLRAGLDGQLYTLDDVRLELPVTAARILRFEGIDFDANEELVVNYILVVGSGVSRGEHTNLVTPVLNGTVVGNTASATIEVFADPFFDLTTIIGKVFHDRNENGIQDDKELGISGVRIATVGGEIITTDEYGRYHFPGVDAGKNDRGRNFILKVDPISLPDGAEFISENPRVLRITASLMSRINFAIKLPVGTVLNRTSKVPQKRAVVNLDEDIFNQSKGLEAMVTSHLSENGRYQLGRLASFVMKQVYDEYLVNVTAENELQLKSRIKLIKKYLRTEQTLEIDLLDKIRFEMVQKGEAK